MKAFCFLFEWTTFQGSGGGVVCKKNTGPKVIKLFSCSTQLSMKFSLLINTKMPSIVGIFIFSYLLAEKFSCSAMFSKKEFAIVNNLRFISRTNFMLSWVEHEKRYITSGPGATNLFLMVLHCKKIYLVCSVSLIYYNDLKYVAYTDGKITRRYDHVLKKQICS